MSKDFNVIHYIQSQIEKIYSDKNYQNCDWNFIYSTEEYNVCVL